MNRRRRLLTGLTFVTVAMMATVIGVARLYLHETASSRWLSPTPNGSASGGAGGDNAAAGGSDAGDAASDEDSIQAAQAQAEAQRQQNEAALTAALRKYDQSRYVDLAVAVVDRRTGETYSYSGQRRFETASIVKVDILATMLWQAQRAGRALTASEKSLATKMIEYSDNDAASQLWSRIGGIASTTKTFGLSATTGGSGGQWGLTTTTAEDQARLLLDLVDPDGPVDNAEYLLGLMSNVDDDQDWGISAAAQPGEEVALKNGWLSRSTQSGRWIVNSVGRINDADTDAAVIVLSRGNSTFNSGVAMVEAVSKLTRTYLAW
jgi:beta-lactamase class A